MRIQLPRRAPGKLDPDYQTGIGICQDRPGDGAVQRGVADGAQPTGRAQKVPNAISLGYSARNLPELYT
ncbi:hypothetical protein D3C71_1449480 [compost metagenome]